MTKQIIEALTKNTANRTEVVAQAFAKDVFTNKHPINTLLLV